MSDRSEIESVFREGRKIVHDAFSSETEKLDDRAALELVFEVLSRELETSLLVLSRQIVGPDPQI
jgi:hypothetical protein